MFVLVKKAIRHPTWSFASLPPNNCSFIKMVKHQKEWQYNSAREHCELAQLRKNEQIVDTVQFQLLFSLCLKIVTF